MTRIVLSDCDGRAIATVDPNDADALMKMRDVLYRNRIAGAYIDDMDDNELPVEADNMRDSL